MVEKIYQDTFPDIAARIIEKTGCTNIELAKLFGVLPDTLHGWCDRYPPFRTAVQRARDLVASTVLEVSLLKKAQGYDVVEHEIGLRGIQAIDIKKTKHIPPDTDAIKFFLSKRNPERWQDKAEDKTSELAEIFAMIINKTRTLPSTRELPKPTNEGDGGD